MAVRARVVWPSAPRGLAKGRGGSCTLESDQAGLFIQRVTKDTALNTFRVFLSAAVAIGKTAKVAWFVIEAVQGPPRTPM